MSSPDAAAPMLDVLTVREPRAISFLTNASNVELVGFLIERDCSIAETAARLGVPVKNLAARMHRMVQLGLALQTGQQRRGGRPIKRYRSRAASFVLVPDDDGADALEQLHQERLAPYFHRIVRAQLMHMRAIARGRLVVRLARDATADLTSVQWAVQRADATVQALPDKPYEHSWGHVRLAPADADAFVADMERLIDHYIARHRDDGELVLYAAAAVPERRRGRRR